MSAPSLTHSSAAVPTSAVARAGAGRAVWSGRVLSGLAVAFLLFDAIGKLTLPQAVVDGMAQLGYPVSVAPAIGIILLACLALYLVPRTAVVGAVLITGFLGGAVASQVRIGSPLLGYTLFPTYVAALVWGGLLLRDARVRAAVGPRQAGR